MRFAYMVRPMNPLLLSCHFANECAQITQGCRYIKYKAFEEDKLAAQ